MSQQLISTTPSIASTATSTPAQTRAKVIAVIRDHLAAGDLLRAGAQAHYWAERLDTHPYLEAVVDRTFAAIWRAQRGMPWQIRQG